MHRQPKHPASEAPHVGAFWFDHAMDFERLRQCLDADFALLRAAIAAVDAKAPVPTCPDWTAYDLAEHTGTVYLHKAECIRLSAFPPQWPPTGLPADPVELLDQTYGALLAQFDAHQPSDPAATWHGPDQTVGFWIRRMAQETVIHRIDAEVTAGVPVHPIPQDLAVDGVDEILKLFLAYGSTVWPREYADALAAAGDERPVLVTTGSRSWAVCAAGTEIEVEDAADATGAAAALDGDPAAMLRRLWNRVLPGDEIAETGDAGLLTQFQTLLVAGTQ
jgi:uncharacterized protein (TIGR03083 family)